MFDQRIYLQHALQNYGLNIYFINCWEISKLISCKTKKNAYRTLKRKSWHLIAPLIFNYIWTVITQKMELWNSLGITLNTQKKTKTTVKLNQLVTRISLMEFVIMLEILDNISNVTFTSWPLSYLIW